MKSQTSANKKSRTPSKSKKTSGPENGQVIHVALRIRSEDGRTVSAHRQVIEQQGCVMFAKLGKGLGPAFLKQLNDQIERGTPTYMFLATYEGPKMPYGYYRCELLHVHEKLNAKQEINVPSYLQQSIPGISTWFERRTLSRLSTRETIRIFVLSSGREISSAITGTASLFKVGVKGDAEMEMDSDPSPKLGDRTNSSLDSGEDDYGDDDKDFVDSWYDSRDL